MTTFLKRIGIFMVLFIVLCMAQHSINLITPYYWGNSVFASKILALKEDDKKDIYFMGSSRIHRHVIPEILDSLTGTRSFNLGVGGTFNPETLFLARNFIDQLDDSGRKMHLVLEVQNIAELAPENINTSEALYFLNNENSSIGYKYFKEGEQTEKAFRYLLGHVKYLVKSSVMIPQILSNFRKSQLVEEFIHNRGYLSIEEHMRIMKTPGLDKRRREFLNNVELLDRRRSMIMKENLSGSKNCSESLTNEYLRLMAKGETKNVKIIFLKPPRATNVRCVFDSLPDSSKIDLSDPEKYPEFYSLENAFDSGHLTESGAQLFSIVLAEELKPFIK